MRAKPTYYLVESSVMPEIFIKVIEAKRLLESGKAKTVNEAASRLSISRSAYYKYKDFIFPFYEISKEKIITLSFSVLDIPGVLSNMLNALYKAGANILTINQNIPVNGIANITISLETGSLKANIESLIAKLSSINGVNKTDILARE